jgi:hypothetical protein
VVEYGRMKQYFALLPEYLVRCANRVGLWVTILAGVIFFIVASAFGLDRVTVPATMAIILLGALEAGYNAYREERVMRVERDAKVRLIARPASFSWNHPDPGPGKIRLEIRVEWKIWTDIDIHTAQICLNIIDVRDKKWWQIWRVFQPSRKALIGLPIKGQDTYQYWNKYSATDPQPIQDDAEFEDYEGLWDGDGRVELELVLETGSPSGKHRTKIDIDLWKRGSREPL